MKRLSCFIIVGLLCLNTLIIFSKIEMITVEKGSFQMGRVSEASEIYTADKLKHEVLLTYDFQIGKYEVTFEDYDRYCTEMNLELVKSGRFRRGARPVVFVSWYDAAKYCNWLSNRERYAVAYDEQGRLLDKNGIITDDITSVEGYRLPTEAEWEYAARGGKDGNDYQFSGGNNLNELGWYEDNSRTFIFPVGSKMPNKLGIHDMSGNVYEWCHDWYIVYPDSEVINPTGPELSSFKVYRGGSWHDAASRCRVDFREYYFPAQSHDIIGFRVARTCQE